MIEKMIQKMIQTIKDDCVFLVWTPIGTGKTMHEGMRHMLLLSLFGLR
jgi:hypothetical protein